MDKDDLQEQNPATTTRELISGLLPAIGLLMITDRMVNGRTSRVENAWTVIIKARSMQWNVQIGMPDRIGVPGSNDRDPDRNVKLLPGERSVWAIYRAITNYIHT
jgi:hypothetical protein